ncbi:MAG: hypothetical protein CUN55_06025 [Phototrophicales bacterium]|nr:MAG: hypothetical protein CUN55_06025 [Phototrophicales bacterium]
MVLEELPSEFDGDPWRVTWSLGAYALRDIASYAEDVEYLAGSIIFSVGDESDAMYLVLKGQVQVWREDAQKNKQMVSTIHEGQSFGEVGLLINQQRLATTIASVDTKLLKVTYDDLLRLEVEKPEFMVKLYKRLAQTLAEQWVLSATRFSEE